MNAYEFQTVPDGMPRLSRGRHRSAKSGACFMEFASYLAGESWSDSPQCTDPLLAHLARAVNDQLGDARRDEIAPDIPRVIGLRGDHRIPFGRVHCGNPVNGLDPVSGLIMPRSDQRRRSL